MKGLFQCPPWARSFCPFRACGAYLRKFSQVHISPFPTKLSLKCSNAKKCLIQNKKVPSPPFTRNTLTIKRIAKKVKGEGLKTLFYIYA